MWTKHFFYKKVHKREFCLQGRANAPCGQEKIQKMYVKKCMLKIVVYKQRANILCKKTYKKIVFAQSLCGQEICLQERANAPCGQTATLCGKKTLYGGRANAPCGQNIVFIKKYINANFVYREGLMLHVDKGKNDVKSEKVKSKKMMKK